MKPKYLIVFPIILMLLLMACSRQEESSIDKPHISPLVAKDISCYNVNSFAEDENGIIWIATFRGLNRFDGHQYYQYFFAEDSTGLPDNQVRDLLIDTQKRMWVATNNGVCLHSEMDNFPRVSIIGGSSNCNNLFLDSKGTVYLTTNTAICSYDETSHQFKAIIKPAQLHNQRVLKATVDAEDHIWALTSNHIFAFNKQGKALFKGLTHKVIAASFADFFYLDKKGMLWLDEFIQEGKWFDTKTLRFVPTPSSLHGLGEISAFSSYKEDKVLISCSKGIFIYDATSQSLTNLENVYGTLKNPSFRPRKMFVDSKDNIWMGEPDDGFIVSYAKTKKFNKKNRFEEVFGRQSVTSVAADKKQNVWIASKKNGLIVYHVPSQTIKQVPTIYNPYYVFVDKSDKIWVSSGKGLIEYAYDGSTLHPLRQFNTLLMLNATEDAQGNIWFAGNNKDLLCIPKDKNTIIIYPISTSPTAFIAAALATIDGNILSSVYLETIYKTNPRTHQTAKLPISESDVKACIRRANFIPSFLFQDNLEDLWIGTVGNGLLHYDIRTQKLTHIEDISCSDVSSAEEDNLGNVWISSMYGLNKYDRNVGKVIQYYESDGIGGNQFYDRASCKLSDGTLVFGGTHGITMFNPADVTYNDSVPIVFQSLFVNNQLVKAKRGGIIDQKIENGPTIHLNYKENNFTIGFNTVDYKEYETAHYYYKLDGSDNMWTDARNNHEATYSSLSPGCYTFKVKVANNLKEKPLAEASIQITISPAPWDSWWARLIYIILFVSLVVFLYQLRMRNYKDKMRMQFLTNISHEFRTPLTMIAGPIGLLAESSNLQGNDRKMLGIVQHSIQRMLRLVNQMLDFNKLNQDTLKLKVCRMDVINSLNNLCDMFLFHAEEKGISIQKHGLEGCVLTWIDADKLDKIMSNLLNNAIKFTPSGGTIDVSFETIGKELVIQVADTGKGIPEDKKENIFKLYYQLDNQNAGTINLGTGVGLYYARKLALLHHGTLVAGNREHGQGAVFTLRLPMYDEAYTEEERMASETISQEKRYPIQKEQTLVAPLPSADDSGKLMILVVDDDPDVVNYLNTILSGQYQVIYRFNAEEALTAMEKEEPNLILSDVVMPGMDGYAFCKAVKEDSRFCHIPVVLVTAKTTIQNQIEGLEKGADAYITKPFSPKLLLALIKSQLDNREKVRQLLNKSTSTDKQVEKALAPQDQLFITQLYKIMEAEIMNPELDANYVAQELGMSRTKFYYKMKGLTGTNPGAFFRTYKLNRAAEYLREGKYNISEIADLTGFSSLSFFSTCFKKQFGVPPSEFS